MSFTKIDQVLDQINKIDGLILNSEGIKLYSLAEKYSKLGCIVEIGSFKGKSTICLAKGSKDGANRKVYAIDPHTGEGDWQKEHGKTWTFDEFIQNVKNNHVADIVFPIVKTSIEAISDIKEPIGMIFIDGCHEYDMVKLDSELWFPKLVYGGMIAFHDVMGWEGPNRAVKELIQTKQIRYSGMVDSLWYGEKVGRNTILDRFRNRKVLFFCATYDFSMLCAKVKVTME